MQPKIRRRGTARCGRGRLRDAGIRVRHEGGGAGDDGCDAAPVFVTDGIAAGTRIATATGWRDVAALCPGDLVLTFDDGLVPVVAVQRHHAVAGAGDWPAPHWPLAVPEGALGNRHPLVLMPDQRLMVDSDLAESLVGDPFPLIPARALAGWRGIAPAPPPPGLMATVPMFADEQVIYGASAVLLHCLPAPDPAGLTALRPPRYIALSPETAAQVVACLAAEEVGAALAAAPARPYAAFG